jgi:hypothetical protein
MATVTGAQTTTTILSNQLAIDIGKTISLLEPDAQVLTVLSRDAESRDTVATKFRWLEDESKARFDTTSAANATTTSLEVAVVHGTYFQQWDQVLNTRTGEQYRIDSVAGNTLTVTRGIGSTATAILEGDELYIIGTAQPENDTSKVARSKTPSLLENNTQIFRTPWEISGTAENVGYMVNPREWDRLERNAALEHAKDIELALLFGRKSATTPGSAEDRTTGGVLSFITSNQTDAGGTLSEAEFNAFMLQVMRYNSRKEALALCSGVGLSALNKFPASKQITKNEESSYGMNVTQYTSPFGTLKVVYHKLMEGAKYGGYIIVVDMEEVAYRPLTNRDTKIRPNIQPNDQDGRKDELLTECGLEFGQQRKHGLISGITG